MKYNSFSKIEKWFSKKTIYPSQFKNFFKEVLIILLNILIFGSLLSFIFIDINIDFNAVDFVENLFNRAVKGFEIMIDWADSTFQEVKRAYANVFNLAEGYLSSLVLNYSNFAEDSFNKVSEKAGRGLAKISQIKIVDNSRNIVSERKIEFNVGQALRNVSQAVNQALASAEEINHNSEFLENKQDTEIGFLEFLFECMVDSFEKIVKRAEKGFRIMIYYSYKAVEQANNFLASIKNFD